MKRMIRIFVFVFCLGIAMLAHYIWQAGHGKEIVSEKKIVHKNIYISSVTRGGISVFENGTSVDYFVQGASDSILCGVADLETVGNQVKKISMKVDSITGKILMVDFNRIELSQYGVLPFHKDMKIYQIGSEICEGSKDELLVGNRNVRFVVIDGKVECALIEKSKKEEKKIRVLLTDTSFKKNEHSSVEVSGTKGLILKEEKQTKEIAPLQSIRVEPKERVFIYPKNGGKILFHSIQRQGKTPQYSGNFEVTRKSGKYLVINELSIEEYLYGVVASEMSSGFELEALKVQAVCARSYAMIQMKKNGRGDLGAHVDDSVSFQVYNNSPSSKRVRQAVDETKNQVVTYQGKIASTYFYSTSCGSMASSREVWYTPKIPYLEHENQQDLSVREAFAKFISKRENDSEDSDSPWYRWKVVLDKKELENKCLDRIKKRAKTNSSYVRLKSKNRYLPGVPDQLGKIKKIIVVHRGKSGIVNTLEIVGEKNSVRVYTEYNVRSVLGDEGLVFQRADGSVCSGMMILPSAFFEIECKKNEVEIRGGGYGHGVGMSQNGANSLAKRGKNYHEIISFYYPGVELSEEIH